MKLPKGKAACHTGCPGADAFPAGVTVEKADTEICASQIPVNFINNALADNVSGRVDNQEIPAIFIVNTGKEEVHHLVMRIIWLTAGKTCNLRVKRVVVLLVIVFSIFSLCRSEDITILFPGLFDSNFPHRMVC